MLLRSLCIKPKGRWNVFGIGGAEKFVRRKSAQNYFGIMLCIRINL